MAIRIRCSSRSCWETGLADTFWLGVVRVLRRDPKAPLSRQILDAARCGWHREGNARLMPALKQAQVSENH